MRKYNDSNGCSIVLFNAPTKNEAKRVRKILLEKKLIRGGFIMPIEPGHILDDGSIKEDYEIYVVFAHTCNELTELALKEIEKISKSNGMSWDLKEGTDIHTDWVMELKKYIV